MASCIIKTSQTPKIPGYTIEMDKNSISSMSSSRENYDLAGEIILLN